MCGILGAVSYFNEEVFASALERLSHRGPDDSGLWSDLGYVTLGHRRLSIMDLTQHGHQPMMDSTGRYVIVFNGEVYNFVEIRLELEKKGYSFQSDSDTEVALVAFLEWGERCQERFNGMWALAIWDKKDKILFLSRDRFGKKPLFYAELPNKGFVFASEMKAIYPFLHEVKPSKNINEHFLFMFNYEHTEECVIEGIKRLPPGCSAIYQDGKLKASRWWNTLEHLVEPPIRYEDQVEQWRELFLDAVRLRMRSDASIGTALSGGLDSSATFSAMAAIADSSNNGARMANDWQHGFCSHYPGSSLDELKWARIVSDSLDLPLDVVDVDPLTSTWSLEEALYQVEDPYLTFPLPMLATYKAVSEAGIKVTLDGHGADELFSGYGHLSSAIASANPRQLAELLAIQESTESGRFSPDYKNLRLRWLKERLLGSLKSNTRLTRNTVKAVMGRIDWDFVNYRLSFEDQSHPEFKRLDPLSRKLYEIFHVTILPTLLRNYDRYSMASGVEIRMPFMDWRLVAFTFSLPWTSKVGGGFTKRIMRDALKGIIPEEIRLRRDKIGWNAPLHEWFRGPLKGEIDSVMNSKQLPAAVVEQWGELQRNPSPDFADGQKVWHRLLPHLWRCSLRRY